MGVPSLHSFQQQHNDVLEKIKMQVRDMKVGFMSSDFSALHPSFTLQNSLGFNAQNAAQNNNQNSLQVNSNSSGNNESPNGHFPFSSPTAAANKDGKWTFKEFNYLMINEFFMQFPSLFNSSTTASNSSTSSETSNSSQQNNNGWSFEEQFKQVRQVCNECFIINLYDIRSVFKN